MSPLSLQYKLCKVKKIIIGTKGIPHLVTHDARTIRYPDPLIKVNDTVRIDLDTGKITDFIKFDTGRFLTAQIQVLSRCKSTICVCESCNDMLSHFFSSQLTCAW